MLRPRECNRMWGTSPNFVVRELDANRGWVIDAVGQDGKLEQLAGVYISAAHARSWIETLSYRSGAQKARRAAAVSLVPTRQP